jgi:hypothetical protein
MPSCMRRFIAVASVTGYISAKELRAKRIRAMWRKTSSHVTIAESRWSFCRVRVSLSEAFLQYGLRCKWRSEHIRGEASPTWRGPVIRAIHHRMDGSIARVNPQARRQTMPRLWHLRKRQASRGTLHRLRQRNLALNNLVTLCRSCHSRTNYHRRQ